MKAKRLPPAQRRRLAALPDWSPQGVGLEPQMYAAALHYLFDRPVPAKKGQEWYWNKYEPDFEATPLEWTRIQTVLFARAGADLAAYSDEQVGMGLNYVMGSTLSNVPLAAIDASVPLAEATRMMQAMPALWRDCIGPRRAGLHAPIGHSNGRLYYVCYMWFDVWPTFYSVRHELRWRDAVWHVFDEMLDVPCRDVQIAALHGIGHLGKYLQRQDVIDHRVESFIRAIDKDDEELRNYAGAAQRGGIL